MRGRLLGIAISASALLVSAGSAAVRPQSPQAYLHQALTLMRAQAVVSPVKGWPAVIRRADQMAMHARTRAQTYGAIIYAINVLYQSGDAHARFANPLTAKLKAQAANGVGTTATPPPTISTLDGKIGVIDVPAIGSSPNSPNGRRYMTAALSAINALQAVTAPCGWIVDLRENTGGDMYPMLLSLSPILGDGTLVGFVARHGFEGYASYSAGVLTSPDGHRYPAPLLVPTLDPLPPVAVLTSSYTLSSGEAVAIAFRGRPLTRSFGGPTGGATTSPETYRLSDGATIEFSVAYDVDRNGVTYKKPIPPDQPTGPLPDSAGTEAAAAQWLLTTSACSTVG